MLVNVYAWFQSNKFHWIRIRQTAGFFSQKYACGPAKHIAIVGQSKVEVNGTKFLGVVIDNKSKWSSHLGHVASKMSKGVSVITKVRKFFDQTTLMSLYNSLILPYMMCCVGKWLWSPLCQTKHITSKKKCVFVMWGCSCINMMICDDIMFRTVHQCVKSAFVSSLKGSFCYVKINYCF